MPVEMTSIQRACLDIINVHIGAEEAVTYRDIAKQLGAGTRKVREAVEALVNEHHIPICSSYDPKRPGYYWPIDAKEVADTCGRLVRHGARIIRRARCIDRAAADAVLGQMRITLGEE